MNVCSVGVKELMGGERKLHQINNRSGETCDDLMN